VSRKKGAPLGEGYSLAGENRPVWDGAFCARPGPHFASGMAATFEAVADRSPDSPAVVYGERRLSYRQLDQAADRLACLLRGRGVRPGDLVGLLVERGADLIVGMLAILKAGGAYLPLDPGHPPQRWNAILESARPPLLVAETHLAAGLAVFPLLLLLEDEREALAAAPATRLGLEVDPSFLAYVLFTSGSTGRPKGVLVPQAGVLRLVLGEESWPGPGRRIGQVASAGFDAATLEIWGALLKGGTVVGVLREQLSSLEKLEDLLARERVEELMLTAPFLHQLIQEKGAILSQLAAVSFGAERCEPKLIRRAAGLGPDLVHSYGPTECSCAATNLLVETLPEDAAGVPIGYALPSTELGLFDNQGEPVESAHSGEPAAGAAQGELYLGGSGLAWGYLGQPALTASLFVPHPRPRIPGERLYRSGDLVARRPDGALDFLGRVDFQVKLRGHRIELGEIESQLAAQPGVAQAVALVDQPEGGTPRLLAWYVGDPAAAPVEPEALRQSLARQLPEYMVPARLMALARLPLNANGKLDRAALPRPAATLRPAYRGPRSEAEIALAGLVAPLLADADPGLDDDLVELGLDSIKILQVVSRAHSQGYELEAEDFYGRRTLEKVAAAARPRPAGGDSQPAAGGAEISAKELDEVMAELDDMGELWGAR
jgi:amino acid adenylation domain-containing protein